MNFTWYTKKFCNCKHTVEYFQGKNPEFLKLEKEDLLLTEQESEFNHKSLEIKQEYKEIKKEN